MNGGTMTIAKCFLTVLLVFVAAVAPVREAAAANVYVLDVPATVDGSPGGTENFTVYVLLTQSDGPVQGYVVGLTVSPAVCSIVDVSLGSGASGAEFFVGKIYPPGNSATAGVVMDFEPPYLGQTIPTVGPGDSPQTLLTVTVAAPVPTDGSCLTCTLDIVNGLGSPPLENIVVIGGLSYDVVKDDASVDVCGSQAPEVDAGPDMFVSCPVPPCSASLQGNAHDPDSAPSPLTVEWKVVSGPGSVTFDDPADPKTSAEFSTPGTYVLALTASDGQNGASDLVEVTVGQGGDGDSGGYFCDPLAHWSLDEGAGVIVRDVSGRSHDGIVMGDHQWSEGPPGFGSALGFDGAGFVEILNEPAFDVTDVLTVAAWVNVGAVSANWTAIVTKGDSAWRLSTITRQPRFHFAVSDPAVGAHWINGSTVVPLGQWHHVAGTYDGSFIRLYIDGEEDPASPVAYSGPISVNNWPVVLADNAEVPDMAFVGRLDDVRIYNCALSSADIQALVAGISADHGSMLVREVINAGLIRDQHACYGALEAGIGTTAEYTAPVLNIVDSGSAGHFDQDASFGVVRQGYRAPAAVDDLSLEASGVIRISPGQGGDWTFGVNSDDGFTLQFPGYDFVSAIGGELVDFEGAVALRFLEGRAAGDTLGNIRLPAGEHPFWLTYHEGYGQAAVEFFAAKGVHQGFDPELFHLVGAAGLGSVAVPGFCDEVRMVVIQSPGTAIDSLADAIAVLSTGRSAGVRCTLVNHGDRDMGGPDLGLFPRDTAFPNDAPGRDENDFAVRVTGLLDIPAGGTYQIGFNSDDGASLRIIERSWKSIVADGTGHAVITGDILANDAVTPWSLTAGEIDLPAGCHEFEAVMFERAGGAFFELIGRGVSDEGVADPSWHLLKVGGARSPAPLPGLALVPQASD
jgi:hypothetical protein